MYHGTTSKNLSSILSEGLNTQHSLVWSKEKDREKASYGGIYFTSNFMTAYSSANTARRTLGGDSDVIVMANLELRTPFIIIDEDQLPSPAFGISSAFKISPNDWWYTQWVGNDFCHIRRGKSPSLDELGDKSPNYILRRFLLYLYQRNFAGLCETASTC